MLVLVLIGDVPVQAVDERRKRSREHTQLASDIKSLKFDGADLVQEDSPVCRPSTAVESRSSSSSSCSSSTCSSNIIVMSDSVSDCSCTRSG